MDRTIQQNDGREQRSHDLRAVAPYGRAGIASDQHHATVAPAAIGADAGRDEPSSFRVFGRCGFVPSTATG